MTANLTKKVFAIDIVNKNDGSLASSGQISPTLQVKIPKVMMGGIFDVTSEKYNQSSRGPDKIIESFKIKETMRVTNVGDTIVDIKLRSDIPDKEIDKLLIKGLGSALIPGPSRPISILR